MNLYRSISKKNAHFESGCNVYVFIEVMIAAKNIDIVCFKMTLEFSIA